MEFDKLIFWTRKFNLKLSNPIEIHSASTNFWFFFRANQIESDELLVVLKDGDKSL